MKKTALTTICILILFAACKKDDTSSGTPNMRIATTYNPYGVNPLCAQLDIEADVPGKIRVEVIGRDGEASNIAHTFDEIATSHSVPVLGLYPQYQNTILVNYLSADDSVLEEKEISIVTQEIPDVFSDIIVDIRQIDKMEPGLTLVSYRGVYNPNMPFMMDAYGKIRWILDYSNYPPLQQLFYDVGLERLQNGNFYFGNSATRSIHEVGVYGELINTWSTEPYDFHHNVQEKPNGNFLLTATDPNSTHLNGNLTHKDLVIEIDRQSGSIINVWDLKESLDEYRTAWVYVLNNSPMDWVHGNAVIYDESDNTIIVSCQRQGVFKLTQDNQVVWILGTHLGWGTNRQGADLNNYLLTPLDASGNSITDQDILDGFDNHMDFEWNWFQHAPMIMPNGNIMLFDNGGFRNYAAFPKYSRAVEYAIDDDAKTIQQIWQYGKERGEDTYSSLVSDVDYLPETGHILFSPGWGVDNGDGLLGGKIIELDYQTKEVIFEARLSGVDDFQFHRAERLSIYP